MSGPIVRRYGFPNFDKIFGKKEIQHGVDEPETQADNPSLAGEVAADKAKEEPRPAAKPES